jgi:hypothetical protein
MEATCSGDGVLSEKKGRGPGNDQVHRDLRSLSKHQASGSETVSTCGKVNEAVDIKAG